MTSKEIVTCTLIGLSISFTVMGVWVAVILSKIRFYLKKIYEQNNSINAKVQDANKLNKMFDDLLQLVRSVQGVTTIKNNATGGNTHDS